MTYCLKTNYLKKLEMKDTTDTMKSASYFDLHLRPQKRKTHDQTKWQTQWFLYCQFFFHLWQHPFSTCKWSFHITTHRLCQSLLKLLGLFVPCYTSYNKAPVTGLCGFKIKVITTEVLWSSSWTHHKNWYVHCVIVPCSFPLSSTPDVTYYGQLGGCF